MSKRNPFKAIALVTGLVASISFVGCGESVVGPAPARQATFTPPTPMPPVEFGKTEVVAAAPAPWDLNRDGRTDASDLSFFAWVLSADLNGDSQVTTQDAVVLGGVIEYQNTGRLIDLNGDGAADASDISVLSLALRRADLNRSGRVDASDVSLYSFMTGRGDVDQDGVVGQTDEQAIRRHIGEITPA